MCFLNIKTDSKLDNSSQTYQVQYYTYRFCQTRDMLYTDAQNDH